MAIERKMSKKNGRKKKSIEINKNKSQTTKGNIYSHQFVPEQQTKCSMWQKSREKMKAFCLYMYY